MSMKYVLREIEIYPLGSSQKHGDEKSDVHPAKTHLLDCGELLDLWLLLYLGH